MIEFLPENETRLLVVRSLAGDSTSFGRLIDREGVRIRMAIARQAGTALRADFDEEDCFQAVVGRAWRDLDRFDYRGGGSFFAWLSAIVRNEIVSRSRYLSAGKRGLAARPVESFDARHAGREPLDPSTSVMTRAARHHDYQVVRRVLEELDPEQRRLIELHFLDELSIRELSATLSIPRATAFDRLERAIATLRSRVDAHPRPSSE